MGNGSAVEGFDGLGVDVDCHRRVDQRLAEVLQLEMRHRPVGEQDRVLRLQLDGLAIVVDRFVELVLAKQLVSNLLQAETQLNFRKIKRGHYDIEKIKSYFAACSALSSCHCKSGSISGSSSSILA